MLHYGDTQLAGEQHTPGELVIRNTLRRRPPVELARVVAHVGGVDHEIDEVVGVESGSYGRVGARGFDDVLRERRAHDFAFGSELRDALADKLVKVAVGTQGAAALECDIYAGARR